MVVTWFVYLLECRNGAFYTGVTNNVARRMKLHKSGRGSKYVKRFGFKQLLRVQECESRSDACQKEYAIKQLPKWAKLSWFDS